MKIENVLKNLKRIIEADSVRDKDCRLEKELLHKEVVMAIEDVIYKIENKIEK